MSAFLNPWFLLGAFLSLVAAAAGGAYTTHYFDKAVCERAALKVEVVQQKSILEFLQEVHTQEIMLQTFSANIATAYEKGKSDAQATAQTVTSGLRTGNLRLRQQWQGCQTQLSQVAGTADELNAALRSREESAGRIVGIAAACDAQVLGLQQLILSYYQILNKPQ